MGFGAIIAAGDKNELLSDPLLECITEVRVEQHLDNPTQYAIRFQEDIVDGEPRMMTAPELQCEKMLAIAVKANDTLKCLVRGPITDVKCSVTRGGPGSWYEVHGQDRRVELDRQCVRKAWTGRASEAADAILSERFETDIEQTNIIYGSPRSGGSQATQTLNQRSTNAAFIRAIARRNNFHCWLAYECKLDPFSLTGRSLKITETAHLKPSPPRPSGALGALSALPLKLVPTVMVALRVNVEEDQCRNVTRFDLGINAEQPNQFSGTTINEADLKEDRTSTTDPQPAIRPGGLTLSNCSAQRDLCVTTAGNQTEMQNQAESALTEAGWYVNATASTTAFMLGDVLLPHDVIEVEGLGKAHSGPYQVQSVTHVINAADHYMDLRLRRNAIGG
ncbi:hypothetical protein [Lyngbya confervoides]|uniref:Uncharacterized protein n=1 Tax=Lyngbya confervoides BDU141951 TaxID=1574623 RepID=A0ABD4T3K8_9CYAN|nr:hypothetical protein [Lyngbya confervoides]MCM1983268.1 hypothetical protein [Lyngbya confervoides BDU141951]